MRVVKCVNKLVPPFLQVSFAEVLTLFHLRLQVVAVEVFHDDGWAFVDGAVAINLTDVRVVELHHDFRLSAKTLYDSRINSQFGT